MIPMRFGIFSDVHANFEALSAVLEAYGSEGIDRYYCLGDTAMKPSTTPASIGASE